MAIFLKDPAATIDYAIDWGAAYLAGQTITASAWTVSPADAGTVAVAGATILAGKTVVTLRGGTPGAVYRVANAVTFSDGRNDERTLVVRVEAR